MGLGQPGPLSLAYTSPMALVTLTNTDGKEVRILPAAVEALMPEEWPTASSTKTRILLGSGTAIVVAGTVEDTATALGL